MMKDYNKDVHGLGTIGSVDPVSRDIPKARLRCSSFASPSSLLSVHMFLVCAHM